MSARDEEARGEGARDEDAPLLPLLRARIAREGPLALEAYVAACLLDPAHGYYATRDPIGAAGDFTTAPEVSQVFGELIGLWAAEAWRLMGAPPRVALVELGPGRGTLMADALRAARALPGFLAAIDLHLVEAGAALRERQRAALTPSGLAPTWRATWREGLDLLPPGPVILIANEFLDALPPRQLVRAARAWRERRVGVGVDGALVFVAGEEVAGPRREAPEGAIVEWQPEALALAAALGRRLAAGGGAALLVDYGHHRPAGRPRPLASSLRAVRRHRFADPLAAPGLADLTVHVDFAAVAAAARGAGAAAHGPLTQGALLARLGLAERLAALAHRAPERAAALRAAGERLAGPAPGMGRLFKALALTPAGAPPPPAFDAPDPALDAPDPAEAGATMRTAPP